MGKSTGNIHFSPPLLETIADRVSRELSSMQEILGDHADIRAFLAMDHWARSTLRSIGYLVAQGAIYPTGNAHSHLIPRHRSLTCRPLRLGVFPIAANPLHWLHVLYGLAAMENLRLDKVVYVIAGEDSRKPMLASEHARHRIAKDVLDLFSPLLEYSAIARGSAVHGEENVFRIIASRGIKPLHAFYIAGGDHYRRCEPSSGNPDTIQKLERGMRRRAHGFNPHHHKLSAVFLDRGGCRERVETFLDIRWVQNLPLQTSSTMIRGALVGEEPLFELSFLPFAAYSTICAHGLYRMKDPLGDFRDGIVKQNYLQEGLVHP